MDSLDSLLFSIYGHEHYNLGATLQWWCQALEAEIPFYIRIMLLFYYFFFLITSSPFSLFFFSSFSHRSPFELKVITLIPGAGSKAYPPQSFGTSYFGDKKKGIITLTLSPACLTVAILKPQEKSYWECYQILVSRHTFVRMLTLFVKNFVGHGFLIIFSSFFYTYLCP